jgi:hypothetical protein
VAKTRYFVIQGKAEKGPYTLGELRESVEQTALSSTVMVRPEQGTEREPLGELLRRHTKPVKAPPPDDVDHAEINRKRREAAQWQTVLLILGIVLFLLRVFLRMSRD